MVELEANEKLIQIIRKHPFPFLVQVVFISIGLVLPSLLRSSVEHFISTSTIPSADLSLALPLLSFGESLWYLFLWVCLFVAWTDYYLDRWTVSDSRIIASEQIGLFNRDTASVRHSNIQDVKVEVRGVLATLLGFGTLHVQSAGESREFILTHTPHPYETKEMLFKICNQAREKESL
jgi:hypothetical protein